MLVGAHMPVAGGLACAIEAAVACGFNCVQLFTHSPRVWEAPLATPEEWEAFKEKRRVHGIRFVIVHAPYLPNFATPDKRLWERSCETVARDLAVCDGIGADAYVMHPGSSKGGSAAHGIRRVAEGMERVCERGVPGTRFLLETTSGAGTMLGGTIGELAEILDCVAERVPEMKTGVCIDTAHVFAAGCDVRTAEGAARLYGELKRTVGLEMLRAIHANDSVHGYGTRRDQHAHIGAGKIGMAGFWELMKIGAFRRVPWILETPKDGDGADVRNRAALERVYQMTARYVR